jgi:hypothetical protein
LHRDNFEENLLKPTTPEEQFFLPGQQAFFEHTRCRLEFQEKLSSEAFELLCLKRRKLRFKRRQWTLTARFIEFRTPSRLRFSKKQEPHCPIQKTPRRFS